ncbi:MAG: sugar ABC transporter substrate-binding protein [Limnochordaceae bacterium]|nr:sugar ABC transporter substrate-binding protein [Limnochordaceae bacterium]
MGVFRRRWFLVAAMATMAAVGLGARAQAKVQITYWTIGTGSQTYRSAQEPLIEEFKKTHPDIDLKVEFMPSDVGNKLTVALASHTEPDIVTLSTRNSPAFIAQGALAPVDFSAFGVKDADGFARLFLPGMTGILQMMGGFYYVPTEVSIFGTWYNQDMLQKAGFDKIGQTWQELADMSKKFIRMDPTGKWTQWGLGLDRGWIWPVFHWVAFTRQSGTDWITADGKPNFADKRAVAGLQFYQDLFLKQHVMDPALLDSTTAFGQGKVAIHVGVSYQAADWERAKAPFTWVSAPYPYLQGGRKSTPAYAYGDFVVATSKHKKEAWEVIKFFTIDHPETWYQNSAIFLPAAGDWVKEVLRTRPYYAAFLQEFANGALEIAHPQYSSISSAIGAADSDLITKGMSVQQVLTNLQEKLTPIMAKK